MAAKNKFIGKYTYLSPNDFIDQMFSVGNDRGSVLERIASKENWMMNAFQTEEGNILTRKPNEVRSEAAFRLARLRYLTN